MRLTLTILTALALTSGCRSDPDDLDEDGHDVLSDCNDDDPSVYPGAEELCDGIDNDCSGDVDEDAVDAGIFYLDGDGDGTGSEATVTACEAPAGYVNDTGDCNDSDATIHPGASEADCTDPTDYNCDGSTGYADADSDGFAACEECDDGNAQISPLGVEVCDGADNDCDGSTDTGAIDAPSWYADTDGDGFGDPASSETACDAIAGFVADDNDCDDTAVSTYPGAEELCNGVDDNCNDVFDEGATDVSPFYLDADGDGEGNAAIKVDACVQPDGYTADSSDCNDLDPELNSSTVWYEDFDADGYGDPNVLLTQCEQPDDYVLDDQDCDDTDPFVNPELWWYDDFDGDGFGDPDLSFGEQGCSQPTGKVGNWDDCDDLDGAIHPDADEICDDADNNCDGDIDPIAYSSDFSTLPSGWAFNGRTNHIVDPGAGTGWIELTDAAAGEASSFFMDTPVASGKWRASFRYNVYGGTQADGMAFAMLNGTDSSLVGGAGGGLGCADLDAVCFGLDTYNGPDHLELQHGTDWGNWAAYVEYGDFYNQGWQWLDIFWDDGEYQVFSNGQRVAWGLWDDSAYPIDDEVLFGFTAATGGAFQAHEIDDVTIGCNADELDDDGDGWSMPDDCDDTNPVFNPGATDQYGDGFDLDCDGTDGVDNDGDGWADLFDCDDDDAGVFPGDGSGTCGAFPETCQEWLAGDAGLIDGWYWLTHPGSGTDFAASCDMSNGGWTEFTHDVPDPWYTSGVEAQGGDILPVTYDVDPAIIADYLASASAAEQYLFKNCKGSGIWPGGGAYSWWTTLGGVTQKSYWPGGSAQCDRNDNVWRSDGGYINTVADLPIGDVRVGDTGDGGEEAYITVGPLRIMQ